LREGLLERIDFARVNGSMERRLPNNLNLSFPGVNGDGLLAAIKGVAVSSGSACTSASLEPSYVLRALGEPEEVAQTSIRFGLGRWTTAAEIETAIDATALPCLPRARSHRPCLPPEDPRMSQFPIVRPSNLTEAFLRPPSETDLHVHLDGSLRLETILDLAEEQKVKLPAGDADGLRRAVVKTPENCGSLVEYLEAFDVTLSVLQQREALTRAAFELAEDCARENIRYFECRYSPILHQKQGLSLPRSWRPCRGPGGGRAEVRHQVRRDHLRHPLARPRAFHSGSPNSRSPSRIAAWSASILPAPRPTTPRRTTAEAFYLILNNNINCTVHAGESFGPGIDPSGHSLLRRAPHRARCAAARGRQPDGLRQRSPHSDRVLHHEQRADAHRARRSIASARLLSRSRAARDGQHRQPACLGHDADARTRNVRRHLGFGPEGIRELIIDGFKSAFLPFHERRRMLRVVAGTRRAVRRSNVRPALSMSGGGTQPSASVAAMLEKPAVELGVAVGSVHESCRPRGRGRKRLTSRPSERMASTMSLDPVAGTTSSFRP
jgi:adenosine deaminase